MWKALIVGSRNYHPGWGSFFCTRALRWLMNFRPPWVWNFIRLVLGCIDVSDSESWLIFQHLSRSTRFTSLRTFGVEVEKIWKAVRKPLRGPQRKYMKMKIQKRQQQCTAPSSKCCEIVVNLILIFIENLANVAFFYWIRRLSHRTSMENSRNFWKFSI